MRDYGLGVANVCHGEVTTAVLPNPVGPTGGRRGEPRKDKGVISGLSCPYPRGRAGATAACALRSVLVSMVAGNDWASDACLDCLDSFRPDRYVIGRPLKMRIAMATDGTL